MAGISERIASAAGSLTPADRRIAHVLSASNMLAGLDTIVKLAQRANVSGPSILRFSAKLGFGGFTEFQDAVREDIQSRFTSPLDLYERARAPQPHGRIRRASEIFQRGIERTLRRLDETQLDRVARALCDVRHPVYFVGGRFTHHLAEMLWGHVYQLRSGAHVLRPGVVSLSDQLVEIGRGDVLAVFDVRRYQADIIELAEQAKARRAHIILFTDTLLSPIARFSRDVLTCDLDTPSPYDSLVPMMALVETVIAAATERAGERGRGRVASIEEARRRAEEAHARAGS
ncbi:MAG TPA: MurR/RpiR family transcriptional regulator [Steroidobacteraceae bacterium]|jgi:DNA-binding MurR/RpiR family transcriptional regulator|nr:MurR/RpiR family transcriptional regulator [Steroidobacteraceae bacterium]